MKIAIAVLALAGVAHAQGEDFGKGTVIFARGSSLFRVDATGKGETEIATFTTKGPVRALRTDALGKTLLVDINGTWGTMPLDGSTKTILSLACAEGPASLAEDGNSVVCRAPKGSAAQTMVIDLTAKTAVFVDVPILGARISNGMLIWADKTGIWSAPPKDLTRKKQVGPDAPLRGFLPSPDGTRAVGVWNDQVYSNLRTKVAAEILMGVQLDGIAARRRAIKNAVPLAWSHDSKWIMVQDGAAACLMGATGGEYKCWKGYTAVDTAPDGRWSIVLGNRDGSKQTVKTPAPAKPAPKKDEPKEGSDEGEDADADADAVPDVPVAMPSGPQSIYRARLEGAFTETPVLLVKIVDGAAVWVPGK